MLYKILAGIIFSAAVILAASEIPLPHRLAKKPVWHGTAAALMTAVNGALLLIFRKRLNGDLAALTDELAENKKAAEEFFPDFLKGIISGIHNILMWAAGLLDKVISAFTGFFESNGETAVFLVTVFVVSSAGSFLLAKYGNGNNAEDITGIWDSISFIIKNEFAGAFLSAPLGSLIIYLPAVLIPIPFGSVLCFLLWALSNIPFVGTAVSVIAGTLILLLSAHPVKALIFLIISSAVFALLNFREALEQLLKKDGEQNL